MFRYMISLGESRATKSLFDGQNILDLSIILLA